MVEDDGCEPLDEGAHGLIHTIRSVVGVNQSFLGHAALGVMVVVQL